MTETEYKARPASETESTVYACPKLHSVISGPIALISIILRVICVAFTAFFLIESCGALLEEAEMAFAVLVLVTSSAEIPMNCILRRMKRADDGALLPYSRKIACGVYWVALISRIGELLYCLPDLFEYPKDAEVIAVIALIAVLACLELAVLIYYSAKKAVFTAQHPAAVYGGAYYARQNTYRPTTFFGVVKTVVFVIFVLAAVIVTGVIIAYNIGSKNYEEYSAPALHQWLDETWQSGEEHAGKVFSYSFDDGYNENTVRDEINSYIYEKQSESLKYSFEVADCYAEVLPGIGSMTVSVDFTYNENGKKYEELGRFTTKEEALRPLSEELRNGDKVLWFTVSSDWTLDDVDALARELSANDVHTAAEWKAWSRYITDIENDGMKLVIIEKLYEMDEDYLDKCSLELADKLAEIKADIESRGYTSDRDRYKAAADAVMRLAEYDDDTRVSTLTDNLSAEEKVNRSAYGALVTGKTVCSGYAYAYKAICDELGLYCQVISGYNGDGSHAWNKIGDGLYVDCTFCDTSGSNRYMFMDDAAMERYEYYMSANQIIMDAAA